MDEILPIVDPDGNVIGRASRQECHSGSFALHPVVHLHVVSPDGRLLLQLRKKNKRIQPGKWDTAVGGHVAYNETIDQALARETIEEIGVDLAGKDVRFITRYLFRSPVEYELVYVYSLLYDGPFTSQPTEIDDLRFFSPDQYNAMVGKNQLTPNFEQEIRRIEQSLFGK